MARDQHRSRRRGGMKRVVAAAAACLLAGAMPCTEAKSNMITTTGVSYCSDPLAIVVDTFDVRYFPDNSSLAFDISAASVTPGLNLEAEISLNAYGIQALNTTIDFCSILSGVLCPLVTYNFTGSGVYTIPSSIVPHIPGIAFYVPDLEAVVTVSLIDTTSGLTAACLQVTLGSGLTLDLASVTWSTAGVLIASFAFALVAALFPTSPIGPGLVFWLLGDHLQHIAYSGVFSLNYPLAFRTWTTNFAYAIGLIKSDAIERAIDRARAHTGGDGITTALDAEAFVSRIYSPYNQPYPIPTSNYTAQSDNVLVANQLIRGFANHLSTVESTGSSPVLASSPFSDLTFGQSYRVPVVTRNTTLLDPGMQAYVNKVGFPPQNAFMTVFIWGLILLLLCLVVAALSGIVVAFISQRKGGRGKERFRFWASSAGLRLTLFAYPALTLFTFFQWTIGQSDSWLPIFLSVISWLAVTFALLVVSFLVWRHVQREGAEEGLDRDRAYGQGRRWEPVFEDFKAAKWWAMAPWLFFMVLKMAFLGFGQGSGKLQVIAMIILETLTLLLLIIFRPYAMKKHTFVAALVSLLHLIVYCILVTFIYSEGIKPIPRTVLGFVALAVQSIAFIVIFIFGLWTLLWFLIWAFRHPKPMATPDVLRSEKKSEGYFPADRKDRGRRRFLLFGRRRQNPSQNQSPPPEMAQNDPAPVSNLQVRDRDEEHGSLQVPRSRPWTAFREGEESDGRSSRTSGDHHQASPSAPAPNSYPQ